MSDWKGSAPKPEAATLWDVIPKGCEVRQCLSCRLVYLSGPGQVMHEPYCPENRDRIPMPPEPVEVTP